jgi:hypothetical protein
VGEVAMFENGTIAADCVARLIYCQEHGVFEIIAPLTTRQDIVSKIKQLMNELKERKVAKGKSTFLNG